MTRSIMWTAAIALAIPPAASAQGWNLDVYGGWSCSNITGKRTALTDGGYASGFIGPSFSFLARAQAGGTLDGRPVDGVEMRNNTLLITAAVGIPLGRGADAD